MTTPQPSPRAQFEALLTHAEHMEKSRSICDASDWDMYDTAFCGVLEQIGQLIYELDRQTLFRLCVALDMPADTAPATLPDDWRARCDGNED